MHGNKSDGSAHVDPWRCEQPQLKQGLEPGIASLNVVAPCRYKKHVKATEAAYRHMSQMEMADKAGTGGDKMSVERVQKIMQNEQVRSAKKCSVAIGAFV